MPWSCNSTSMSTGNFSCDLMPSRHKAIMHFCDFYLARGYSSSCQHSGHDLGGIQRISAKLKLDTDQTDHVCFSLLFYHIPRQQKAWARRPTTELQHATAQFASLATHKENVVAPAWFPHGCSMVPANPQLPRRPRHCLCRVHYCEVTWIGPQVA